MKILSIEESQCVAAGASFVSQILGALGENMGTIAVFPVALQAGFFSKTTLGAPLELSIEVAERFLEAGRYTGKMIGNQIGAPIDYLLSTMLKPL